MSVTCISVFRRVVFAMLLAAPMVAGAQELYVFSEPASNMPARSLSFKLTARYPESRQNNIFRQRYVPEVMFGLSKNWMLHFGAGFSDYYSSKVRHESLKMYLKYRFLSNDEVHKHFRMAAFFEAAYSRNDYLYQEFSFDGDLSGFSTGIIATKLVNRLAVSGTLAFMKGFTVTEVHHNMGDHHPANMWNYSLSAGYLVLPKEYTSYKQTNLNLYLELLGGQGAGHSHHYVDLAPAVQLIFNSTTKLNLGARFQLSGNMTRAGERTYQVAVEHTILNAFKKRNATQH
ncbi:MAG TPA: hypothetical protein VD996_17755 [Chitinophagaceae bacterium]|nr:hypothetical protein [Chitinophagaceae bacterium]